MFNTTIDDILADFHKKISKLDELQALHIKKQESHNELANEHSQLAMAAALEASRAERIKSKLNKLLA